MALITDRPYLGHYMIAFYEIADDEELVLVADNAGDLAYQMGITKETAFCTLGRLFPHHNTHSHVQTITIRKKPCVAYFINLDDDSDMRKSTDEKPMRHCNKWV